MPDDLLSYYNDSLEYLRQMGHAFAREYPDIGRRLALDANSSADPHVERLLEGVAFLNARIEKKLDDNFPAITQGFFNILQPNYLRPIPSAAIVQFQYEGNSAKQTAPYEIPRGTGLEWSKADSTSASRNSENDLTFEFRTCYPVSIWPVSLRSADLAGPAFFKRDIEKTNADPRQRTKSLLRLTFDIKSAKGIEQLSTLRLFLNADSSIIDGLYRLLGNSNQFLGNSYSLIRVTAETNDQQSFTLPPPVAVGFEKDEMLLPLDARISRAHQLLIESFAFPQKYRFFDLRGLERLTPTKETRELTIWMEFSEQLTEIEQYVSTNTFLLNCAPVINLYPQAAAPVRITREDYKYHLTPNLRQKTKAEIYSIDEVHLTDTHGKVTAIPQIYSLHHGDVSSETQMYWVATRDEDFSNTPSASATRSSNVYLSLVDLQLERSFAVDQVLTAELTCSDGVLPYKRQFSEENFKLIPSGGGPFSSIDFVLPPTCPVRPELGKSLLWRLTSNLSLNHISITSGDSQPTALRETLLIYALAAGKDASSMLQGIQSVDHHRATKRITRQTPFDRLLRPSGSSEPSLLRGININVTLDEEKFKGHNIFLFASLLDRFFGLYSSVNSFSQLTVNFPQKADSWIWAPRMGEKLLF